jgi:TonB family protein
MPVNLTKLDLDDFVETFNRFLAGMVSVEQIRKTVGQFLEEDEAARKPIKAKFISALRKGSLSREVYQRIVADIDGSMSEDAPTEWSVETVKEPQSIEKLEARADTVELVELVEDKEEEKSGSVVRRSRKPAARAAKTATPAKSAQPKKPKKAKKELSRGMLLSDRFILDAQVTKGGMGEIYRALDRRKKQAGAADPWVAIKVISQPFAKFPQAMKALQQEAANSQNLSHPNVIRIFDFDRDGDRFFITMEWLDGESLAKLLDRNRLRGLSAKIVTNIIAGIGRGLFYAHQQGVVHADVKPGNIFITRDGTAKLLDFGVARAGRTGPDGFDPSTIGAHTPAYASCEVLEGAEPTVPDDVYSLACVAYRMLAGRRVWGRSTALEAESEQRAPAPIDGLQPEQWQGLCRALAFRQADRTPDVSTFMEELFVTGATTPDEVQAELDQLVEQSRTDWRSPGLLAAAASVAMISVVTALFWSGGDESEEPASARVEVTADRVAVGPPAEILVTQVEPAPAPKPVIERSTRVALVEPEPAPKPVIEPPVAPQAKPAPVTESKTAEAANPPEMLAMVLPAPPEQTDPEPAVPAVQSLVPLSSLEFEHYVEPAAADSALETGGWVQVQFLVNTDGETRNVRVMSANPSGQFEDSAVAAVSEWRFRPVVEDMRPVEVLSMVRLRFDPE